MSQFESFNFLGGLFPKCVTNESIFSPIDQYEFSGQAVEINSSTFFGKKSVQLWWLLKGITCTVDWEIADWDPPPETSTPYGTDTISFGGDFGSTPPNKRICKENENHYRIPDTIDSPQIYFEIAPLRTGEETLDIATHFGGYHYYEEKIASSALAISLSTNADFHNMIVNTEVEKIVTQQTLQLPENPYGIEAYIYATVIWITYDYPFSGLVANFYDLQIDWWHPPVKAI